MEENEQAAASGQQENAEASVRENENEVEDTREGGDSAEELKAQLEAEREARRKSEEIAENQRIRAEKAERQAKAASREAPRPQQPQADPSGLSVKDAMALMEAKVPSEDIDDVVEYARLKGISPAEALKTGVVRAILADKSEQRRVAAATSSGPARKGASKVPESALLEQARARGELPESDADIRRLVEARARQR